MFDEGLVHQEMRDRVKTLANQKGGRRKLANELAVSYDFICDICDGRYYPPIDLFELRFGPLKSVRREESGQMLNNEIDDDKQLEKANLPITVRCEEFVTLTKLMRKLGYNVRIVVDR